MILISHFNYIKNESLILTLRYTRLYVIVLQAMLLSVLGNFVCWCHPYQTIDSFIQGDLVVPMAWTSTIWKFHYGFTIFFWNRLPMNLCNELLCFSFPLFCRFLKTMLFDRGVMTNTHQLSGQKWPWTVFPLMPRRPNFLVWSPLTMSCGYIQNSKSQCGYKCSFWTLMETLPLISFSWRGAI